MREFPSEFAIGDIRLRPLCDTDLPQVAAQLSNREITQWLAAVPAEFGPAEAEALKSHSLSAGEELRVIEVGGALAGCLCIGAGLWYWLDQPFQGRGIMKAALGAALKAWFSGPVPPLLAMCRSSNTASRGLLTRLGFSQSPNTGRMFFQSIGRADVCHQYIMTPEQWHMLHPPIWKLASLTLKPAQQKDAQILARMLPVGENTWPTTEALPNFIETHRVRCPRVGLFKIEDQHTRCIGLLLCTPDAPPEVLFLSDIEAQRHTGEITGQLKEYQPG